MRKVAIFRLNEMGKVINTAYEVAAQLTAEKEFRDEVVAEPGDIGSLARWILSTVTDTIASGGGELVDELESKLGDMYMDQIWGEYLELMQELVDKGIISAADAVSSIHIDMKRNFFILVVDDSLPF